MDFGLTQEQLAKKLGVRRESVQNWEVGRENPYLRVIPRILEFLGYNPMLVEGPMHQRILEKRRSMGLSQGEFAALVGVDRKSIHYWETGARTPKGLQLEHIQNVLDG